MSTDLKPLLHAIVKNNDIHAKWLNTLSYLENCGARKIAACEHPTLVKEEMLKHAMEEFRHSHYLKSQIKKITKTSLYDYSLQFMIGGVKSLHYLNSLDVFTARFLIEVMGSKKNDVRKFAYVLVTYAIELRAKKLYMTYHDILKENDSKIYVKSILLEEEGHLEEMEQAVLQLPYKKEQLESIFTYEAILFEKWVKSLKRELNLTK